MRLSHSPSTDDVTTETPSQVADIDFQSEASRLVPLLVRRREAAKMCGLSPASWARLVSRGLVPRSIKLGSAVLWRVDELRAWTEAGCPPRAEWESMRAVANVSGRPSGAGR